MQKLDLKTVPKKLKPNPIFKGLPKYLKDVAIFDEVENKLVEILKTDHKHKTASSYMKCNECQLKREERKKKMKEIGFSNLSQYFEWKKIMTIIKNKKSFQLK
jgi:hypothetical protein